MSSGKQNKPFPIKYRETYTHRSRMHQSHYHSFLLVPTNCSHKQCIIISHLSCLSVILLHQSIRILGPDPPERSFLRKL
jgi:hypothetical protein